MWKQTKMMKKQTGKGIKCQFGERVPRNFEECKMLDEINGNAKWQDANDKEVKML